MTDPLCVTVECWENQRYHPTKKWGPHRLPLGRRAWTNKRGDAVLCRDSFLTPVGWVWASDWGVSPNGDNRDGWFYAADFTIPTRFCTATPQKLSYVRRRRWVRTRTQLTADTCGGPALSEAACASAGFCADTRSVWLSTSFYGFCGASVEEQRVDQHRQHISCYRLHRFFDIFSGKMGSPDDTSERGGRSRRFLPRYRHPSVTAAVLNCVYQYGLPQCLRPTLWLEWSGAAVLLRESPRLYEELLGRSEQVRGQPLQDILQDVVRTAPRHPFFAKKAGGAEELRNVLLALELGRVLPSYHQAFSYIAAAVLLNLPARDAFWVVTALFTTFVPRGYHEQCTLKIDLEIYDEILAERFPDVHAHFRLKHIDVSVFASGWLQGLFCAHFPFCTAARILDVLFADGDGSVLVRFLVAFTNKFRKKLLTVECSGSLGYFANEWARKCFDINDVVRFMEKDGLTSIVHARREEIARRQTAA